MYFKRPYQANVMNTFVTVSRMIVRIQGYSVKTINFPILLQIPDGF